jgi:hypothetical protein
LTSGDVPVEGWSETLTHESWTITTTLLPWDLFEAFTLDDSTYPPRSFDRDQLASGVIRPTRRAR